MDNLPTLSTVDTAPVALDKLRNQVNAIQEAMASVMQDGTHYGVIPGCGDKPALFKPGAEKICLMFRLLATFEVTRTDFDGGHREFSVVCTLKTPQGSVVGQGVGSCSTLESRYRWRTAERKCPECGATAIIKGKAEYGGGWLCWKKKDGCNAKFEIGDSSIENQPQGRVENPDIADQYNTVLKMAKKRAHVDATLTCTAASDIFTQDVEDLPELNKEPQSDTVKSNGSYSYNLDKISPEKIEPAVKLLESVGATLDAGSGNWHAPQEIKKLVNYRV